MSKQIVFSHCSGSVFSLLFLAHFPMPTTHNTKNVLVQKRYHNSTIINSDFTRGGISLENEKTSDGTTSRLLLTRASFKDSGNYSCVSASQSPDSPAPILTALPDSIGVQVVKL
jgi:hypothetical protein